ncbi:MAG: RNA polymerase sigma factor [Planctomycetes bacterium]|nr:RNA polymerase sigma factor [Planctomycetota bacterium]
MSLLQRAGWTAGEGGNRIVRFWGPPVQTWCRRASLRADGLADVFQESFRAVSSHLDSFKPMRDVGSFRSWLRTIVRTKVADHFRKLNNQPAGQGGTEAAMRIGNVADPLADPLGEDDEAAAEDEHTLIVQRAMELIRPEFTERNWQAFLKVAIDGNSATEIAQELGVNPQAIRQANYRIRRRLRLVLQDLIE